MPPLAKPEARVGRLSMMTRESFVLLPAAEHQATHARAIDTLHSR
jgi:hypothetical protein